MNQPSAVLKTAAKPRSDRFHLWRSRKDTIARRLIGAGGVSVIVAVVMIFFYLLWVVFPLFLPAQVEALEPIPRQAWQQSEPMMLGLEEQQEVGMRLSSAGVLDFFNIADDSHIRTESIPAAGQFLAQVAVSAQLDGSVTWLDTAGGVGVFKHIYRTEFSGGVDTREIVPVLESPYGEETLFRSNIRKPVSMAYSDDENGLAIVVAGADGKIEIFLSDKSTNLMTGELRLDPSVQRHELGVLATTVAVSSDRRWLYAGDKQGQIHAFALPGFEKMATITTGEAAVTELRMLLGGFSLLAGLEDGRLLQLFPIRDEQNEHALQQIREFTARDGSINAIVPEARRKGFLVLDDTGTASLYHSTANRHVKSFAVDNALAATAVLSPRSNGLLIENSNGGIQRFAIDNEHPEISFSSLWSKVWYENYQEPEFIWQSSAANNEFEPKFSLTPLVFGTIKAAFYAMLFAIPLALMGAAYTAYFMAPQLRQWVKPGIEIMAALPTVILGFLAGLWFAPFLEEHLAAVFMLLLVIPVGLLLMAWLWHQFAGGLNEKIPPGWEPLLQVPMIILLALLAVVIADPVQSLFFDGDLRTWLSQTAGISYDQRNAVVVGVAMGFAVVPTIFSIAEDAIFGVPESLSNGSLALGATPWQTMVKIVLPTASPGIFSGLMIGLGRAVGETMIVLMATGNTPVMDWNMFEGMRTLAANIAVEMPESEVNSSHYRVLFLAALVLFMFTFVVNTVAEIIRQRLREKYSSL